LARRLNIELEVQWQTQTPHVHGVADRKGSFSRQTGLGKQAIGYVICLQMKVALRF
jgi:hypothetical protein